MRVLILSSGVLLGIVIQGTWLHSLNLPGSLTPDLMLVMAISYGLLRGPDDGLFFGLITGFFMDLLSGGILGIQALTRMAAGFSAGLLEKTIFKDNLLVPVIAGFIGTLVFESFSVLLFISFKANYNFLGAFVSTILPLSLYNAFFAPIVYYFLLKMERYLEKRLGNL